LGDLPSSSGDLFDLLGDPPSFAGGLLSS
jgi:hypothetical protein